jgi:hypothetical protein
MAFISSANPVYDPDHNKVYGFDGVPLAEVGTWKAEDDGSAKILNGVGRLCIPCKDCNGRGRDILFRCYVQYDEAIDPFPSYLQGRADNRHINLSFGVAGKTKVWLDGTETREELLGLVVIDGGVDDNILFGLRVRNTQVKANLPINGGDEAVFVGQLQRLNDTEDFGRVTAGTGGVVDDGADDLLGVNEEDRADGQCHTLGVDVGGILVIDHVIEVGNFALLVGDDGEGQVGFCDLVDIRNPLLVRVEGVGTQPNEFDTSLGELGLEFGESAELW